MSSFNYGPLARKAGKLIARYGKDVVLSGPASPGPADAGKPWRGPAGATFSLTVKGVVAEFDRDEINGESVRTTDEKLLVSPQDAGFPAGFDIETVTTATVGGRQIGATNLGAVEPGDTAMLYVMRLRNG